ncbi:hypothetical protein KIN20_023603 [Parelaphostrongylus tenuis]|uniref:Uncharacterized protein n=1 Tax=Parelaphostrongylus tenuis TaxID=148309 RepID=A0AAD5QT20_PARTN|nr:hypothetical protein KIN20_023603 [Parelaphostrongylus tenuis]
MSQTKKLKVCGHRVRLTTTRGDVITAMVHEQMGDFYENYSFFASMDLLFEGMMEDDGSIGCKDKVVSVSEIIQKIWLGSNEGMKTVIWSNFKTKENLQARMHHSICASLYQTQLNANNDDPYLKDKWLWTYQPRSK